jgi:type II secretory pathway pseudopilin PulG
MFSIIITGAGLVSAGAFDQLTAFTDDQEIQNADRGMQSAASTIDNIHRNGDTYREFDLSLNGGDIWFNQTAITISSTNNSFGKDINSTFSDNGTVPTGALEHRFERANGEVNLAYEAGAVFWTDTVSPRYGPSMSCEAAPNDDGTIVSLVNLTTSATIDESATFRSQTAIQPTDVPEGVPVTANSRFISFRAELIDSERAYVTDLDGNITINVSEGAYPNQWQNYLEKNGWVESSSDVYTCETNGSVLIRVVSIELSIIT